MSKDKGHHRFKQLLEPVLHGRSVSRNSVDVVTTCSDVRTTLGPEEELMALEAMAEESSELMALEAMEIRLRNAKKVAGSSLRRECQKTNFIPTLFVNDGNP